jgi:hypothetical protein
VERWELFEIALQGPRSGNPFVDIQVGAKFRYKHREVAVDGFYDGDGVYRVRFMPDTVGEWSYETTGSVAELAGQTGSFTCTEATPGNHGPVHVYNTFHFAYADGTPYISVGTTCYAWIHQTTQLQEQTLATLKTAPFNKMRMCVFPKHYPFNQNEPDLHPYLTDADGRRDFCRPNPAYFRHLDRRVLDLQVLGVEADIIVFHPYDCWGYSTMTPDENRRYVRYLVARLAAYRNVWWSMANEYDFMLKTISLELWDELFQTVQQRDPYGHMRSIHQAHLDYDYTKPWVTHASVQKWDVIRSKEWRKQYQKPLVNDEPEYEGNIAYIWGNLEARELVHRFWVMFADGTYGGHGETYMHPEDVLWWSKGGVLHGESPARIAFLRSILEEAPAGGLTPLEGQWFWQRISGSSNGNYRLIYFGAHQPKLWSEGFPTEGKYQIDVIDTWNMTITPLAGTFEGPQTVELPGKARLALRVRPVE